MTRTKVLAATNGTTTVSAPLHEALQAVGAELSYDEVWVDVAEIYCEEEYQRDLKDRRVAKMAASWTPALCHPLWVNMRDDNTLWVIDGQHRWAAAARAGVQKIKATVFYGLTLEQEAALFTLGQQERVGIRFPDAFRARIAAREPIAVTIQECVASVGGTLDYTGASRESRAVKSLAVLEQIYQASGPADLRYLLRLLCDAWPDDHQAFSEPILAGMHILLREHGDKIDRERLVVQLTKVSPVKLRRMADGARQQVGGSLATHIAIAMAREYNVRLGAKNELDLAVLLKAARGLGKVRRHQIIRESSGANLRAMLTDTTPRTARSELAVSDAANGRHTE